MSAASRQTTWLLVVAGLTLDEPRRVPEHTNRRSLALAHSEIRNMQGWFAKFVREDERGCWVWHGARFVSGYGACGFRGTTTVAHRAIWQILIDDLPNRLDLDHLCRNRACVNPDHLEAVTRSMNLTRGAHPTQGRLGSTR